jgi:hypothetical protein
MELVKMTFAKDASVDDPKGLFNASLEGNTHASCHRHRVCRVFG